MVPPTCRSPQVACQTPRPNKKLSRLDSLGQKKTEAQTLSRASVTVNHNAVLTVKAKSYHRLRSLQTPGAQPPRYAPEFSYIQPRSPGDPHHRSHPPSRYPIAVFSPELDPRRWNLRFPAVSLPSSIVRPDLEPRHATVLAVPVLGLQRFCKSSGGFLPKTIRGSLRPPAIGGGADRELIRMSPKISLGSMLYTRPVVTMQMTS